ncbi:MAG: acetyl-CoA C-acetyltransferase [Flaviflexus sp.]|nr:acetyl-CoA C-acetyltransferase [Flaviflexus sp.]
MDHPRPVAIIGGNRIPFARAGGAYAGKSNKDMLSGALAGLVARYHLAGEVIEVAAGAVLRHAADTSLTREALLDTQLDPASPGLDVSRACATSLDAAGILADRISLGRIDAGIAAGVDSASDIPVEFAVGPVLAKARRAKGVGRAKALLALRPRHLAPVLPALAEPRTGLSMGEHQEISNRRWNIERAAQDELAAASQSRLAEAWERGFFDDLVTDYAGLDIDENLRDTSEDKLARLAPAFGGTMTAGNSSGLTDGAASVLLASEDWARERHLPILARLVDYETGAVDFAGGQEGLLTAPMMLAPRLLARHGLTLADMDLVEIHEAFAATVLMTLTAWEDEEWCRSRLGLPGAFGTVDRDRLNVTGSSIATGHPFAATGARILATAAKALSERGGGRALITVCAAGGQGSCALIEAAP